MMTEMYLIQLHKIFSTFTKYRDIKILHVVKLKDLILYTMDCDIMISLCTIVTTVVTADVHNECV